MVIDRFSEHDLNFTNTSPSQALYGDTFSVIDNSSPSFSELFARTKNAFTGFVDRSVIADDNSRPQSYYSDNTNGQRVDDSTVKDDSTIDKPSLTTNPEQTAADDGAAISRRTDTAEKTAAASSDDDSEEIADKSAVGDRHADRTAENGGKRETEGTERSEKQDAHSAPTVGRGEEELASVSSAETVVRGADANGTAKRLEAVTDELATDGSVQTEVSRASAVVSEQSAGVRSLHGANQAEPHAAVAGEQSGNESGNDAAVRTVRIAAIEQSSEGQGTHSDGQSEQQRGRSSHTGEPVRIALINRGGDGHQQYQTGIREQQLDGGGATKTVQEFRQFLQREISPSVVKHARFVFHNDQESEIRILLKPAELGVMRVKLFMQNNTIHGKIVVDSAFAKDIIENNLVDLQKTLRENGLQGGEIDVALHSHTQSSHDSQHHFSSTHSEERYEQQLISEQAIENNPLFLNSALIDLYA